MAAMDWKELLSAYVDGELDAEWRLKAERVLAESAKARAYLADLKRVDRALGLVPELNESPVSAELRERFAARASRELGVSLLQPAATLRPVSSSRGRQTRLWIIGGSVAAVAAALLLALSLGMFAPVAPNNNTNGGGVAGNMPDIHVDSPSNMAGGPDESVSGLRKRLTPAPDGTVPTDDMLSALELLSSDVDMVALAALEDEDIDLLGDTEYLAMLASYDSLQPTRKSGD
ncbi:MAG: anti-sigma factor [Planctomycetota bacterium]